jgi:hypothetical protein
MRVRQVACAATVLATNGRGSKSFLSSTVHGIADDVTKRDNARPFAVH